MFWPIFGNVRLLHCASFCQCNDGKAIVCIYFTILWLLGRWNAFACVHLCPLKFLIMFFPFTHLVACLPHQFVENSLYSTSDILCGYLLQREAQMYLTVLSLKGSSNPAVPLIYNIAMIDGLFRGGTCKNSLEECLTIIDTWWVLSCLPWSYNQRFHATVFNIADIFAMRIFLEVHAISHKP